MNLFDCLLYQHGPGGLILYFGVRSGAHLLIWLLQLPPLGSWPFDKPRLWALCLPSLSLWHKMLSSSSFFFHPCSWLFLVLCLSCLGPRGSSYLPRVARDCAAPSWGGRCSFSHSCAPPPSGRPGLCTDLDRQSAGETHTEGRGTGAQAFPHVVQPPTSAWGGPEQTQTPTLGSNRPAPSLQLRVRGGLEVHLPPRNRQARLWVTSATTPHGPVRGSEVRSLR